MEPREQTADKSSSRFGMTIRNELGQMNQVFENIGAGEGNRTLVISLEGCCSTIELHPRRPRCAALRRAAAARRAGPTSRRRNIVSSPATCNRRGDASEKLARRRRRGPGLALPFARGWGRRRPARALRLVESIVGEALPHVGAPEQRDAEIAAH